MPTGVYDREKAKPNLGIFKKGQRPWNKDLKGIHLSPESEFEKGMTPWNKGLIGEEYKEHYYNGFKGIFQEGQRGSPDTEFKEGNKPPWTGKRRLNFSGANHPNWKGGVSSEYQLRISQRRWRMISKEVRSRDNFICQECGKYPAYDVHHIIPWRLTHNDSLDNLILLCKHCHLVIEWNTNFG